MQRKARRTFCSSPWQDNTVEWSKERHPPLISFTYLVKRHQWCGNYLSEMASHIVAWNNCDYEITKNNNLISRENSVCCYCDILYSTRLSHVMCKEKVMRWNLKHIAHSKIMSILIQPVQVPHHRWSTYRFNVLLSISMCGVNIQANPVIKLMVVPMCCRSPLGDSGFFCVL